MLKLTNICHSFGENPVLKGFSLDLGPGERVALMGPSGVGKTTVLRIVMGLLAPDRGSVENGFSKTAVVFQEPRLLPWRTGEENVNLVLGDKLDTMPRARAWLERLGLKDAGTQYPSQLSGGMQQRVALARAMALEGDLLILDEPFKGLDEALREEVMARVAGTNAAILMVTHDEEEAEALGCRILPMAPMKF